MTRAPLILALCALALAACASSTAPANAAMVGNWTYSGTRDAPSSAQLDGAGTFAEGDGGFEGTFTITERGVDGSVVNVSGTAAGSLVDDSIADFDLTIRGVARRHIGVLRGDSVSGTWATTGTQSNASGSFVLRRVGP